MKENDDLNQKIYGNIHVYKCYKYDIAPPHPAPAKNQRYRCSQKIDLRVTFPSPLKKMIFILQNMVFLLKYHIIDILEIVQEAATGDVL